MSHGLVRLFVITAALLALSSPSRADFAVTGDPIADSLGGGTDYWLAAGNSLQFGRYIRGDGNFSFDMYRARLLVSQATALQAVAGWLPGDSVFALGGVISTTLPGGFPSAYTGDGVNTNLTDSVRLVSKFNTSSGTFTASTVAPDQGNGAGSFSAGNGGVGSVLIATDIGQVTNAATARANSKPGAGVLTRAGINQYYGSGVSNITDANARFIYKYDETTQRLTSWEVFLNVSRLGVELTPPPASPNTTVPEWDGHWNQSLQRGTNDFTDAVNQHMPLPPTLVALAIGGGLLGLGRRLRRATA